MKRSILWAPLIVLLCIGTVLGFDLSSGRDPSAVATPLKGQAVPPLDLPGMDVSGPRLNSADFKGKPRLINFFASWCGPCAAENPVLMALARQKRIEIDGVAARDNADALQNYFEKRGNPYDRIGIDETGHTAIEWGVSGVPETFAVNAGGRIVDKQIGELREQDIDRLIKAAQ